MPINSIDTFRSISATNNDTAVRIDAQTGDVTAASLSVRDRVAQVLHPSSTRREGQEVAQHFINALKAAYGSEIGQNALKSVRGDAVIDETGNLRLNAKKPLSTREIKLASSAAEGEATHKARKTRALDIAKDYFVGGEKFTTFVSKAGVNPRWSTAQQNYFNQRITGFIEDLVAKDNDRFKHSGVDDKKIEKAIEQALKYVDGLSTNDIANKQFLFREVRDQSAVVTQALIEGKNISAAFGALIGSTEHLIKDAALGVDIEIDNDAVNDARLTIIRDSLSSISPGEALKVLEAFNKLGTQARSFLLALGVNTGRAAFNAKELEFLANSEVSTNVKLFLTELGQKAGKADWAEQVWSVYEQGFNATTSEAPLSKDDLATLLNKSQSGGHKSFSKHGQDINSLLEHRLSFHETNRLIEKNTAISVKPFLPESGASFVEFAQNHNAQASTWGGAKIALYRARLAETVREDHESSTKPKTHDREGLEAVASKLLSYIDKLSEDDAQDHLRSWGELEQNGLSLANALASQAPAAEIATLLTSYVNQRNSLAPDIIFKTIDARLGLGGDDRASLSNQAIDAFVDQLSVEDAHDIAANILKPNSAGRALIIAGNVDLTRRDLTSALDTRSSSLASASRSTSALLLQMTQRLAEKGRLVGGKEQVRFLASDLYSRPEADVSNEEFINLEFKPIFFEKAQITPNQLGDALGTFETIIQGQLAFV